MPWKIGENIIAGQVSATPKQDPGVSRYTKPMPRNGLESINSGASSCRYKYPRELRIIVTPSGIITIPSTCTMGSQPSSTCSFWFSFFTISPSLCATLMQYVLFFTAISLLFILTSTLISILSKRSFSSLYSERIWNSGMHLSEF